MPLAAPQPSWWKIICYGRNPRFTLARVLVLVVACFVTFKFALLPIRIEGISMSPTYRDGSVNFINRLAYSHREPQRGDIVSVRLAGPSVMFMKRIIALPGETISFHDGHVFINHQPLAEPYLRTPCDWSHAPIVCGPTQFYVVGDNRTMPFESHTQGRAERNHIVGKLLL